MIRVASLHIYPLKAARAVDLGEAVVEPWGLAGDRRWLLVDEDGRFISQRESSALARARVTYGPVAGQISVAADGMPGCRVAPPSLAAGAEMVKVTVWSSVVPAAAAGPAAGSRRTCSAAAATSASSWCSARTCSPTPAA